MREAGAGALCHSARNCATQSASLARAGRKVNSPARTPTADDRGGSPLSAPEASMPPWLAVGALAAAAASAAAAPLKPHVLFVLVDGAFVFLPSRSRMEREREREGRKEGRREGGRDQPAIHLGRQAGRQADRDRQKAVC